MRGGEIGREAAASGHQRRVFQPPDRAADPFHSGSGGRGIVIGASDQSGWMRKVRGTGANQAS